MTPLEGQNSKINSSRAGSLFLAPFFSPASPARDCGSTALAYQVSLLAGYKRTFFVVWTCKGKPHVEVITFDYVFWKEILSKLIVFFKSYVQRVLLNFRSICYCLGCGKVCLEPEEFDNEEQNSIQCESCTLWCHWACTGSEVNPDHSFVCQSCTHKALD